ncbi:site-specific integrase [Bradyrhizobium sp. 157]|uniref:tyrosine-type recombinase/integrase n=1 Tax=Bradyrhizobium sp. 157 TaxID=2782631 RepID=UPI001FF754E4|nr:site-specific integrase [Bradyrhizobium sp. 157]MCK1641946.1 site-specific integrase [Bradyrhizobium sp. 157]
MSVRKRVWTTQSGETREAYVVQYSIAELDKRNKRKRVIKTFDRKKEADAFHAQVRVDLGKGTHVPASKSPTVEVAGRNWIDACVDLERTTVDGYEQHLRDHINPYLGSLKLSALTVGLVRDWQDKLRKGVPAPGQDMSGQRSADMVKRVTGTLGSVLSDAQERGHVGQNVVRSLRANRKRGKERKAERRAKGRLKVGVDIPAPDEIDAILKAADGRWKPFLLVAIRCGLRASELRGLRWQDVDVKKGELHVHQRADAYNEIGPPKSEAGERTVPVPPTTLNALREWKLVCPKQKSTGRLHYVFPNGEGNVEAHANIITRGLIPSLTKAGVTGSKLDEDDKPVLTAKYTGLHSLRHFFASWCINRKVDGGLELPLKVVSERLGHSNIAITADLYGHLFPRADDSAELAAAEGQFG